MKRAAYSSSHWLLLSAVIIPLTAAGCRTGSSWSPSSMFAWNRQPDAEAIGGPEIPTGPAEKYTPNAIASVGAQNGGTDNQSGGASAYGYTGESVAAPKAGLAARANGFSSGLETSAGMSSATGVQDKPYEISPGVPQGTAGGSLDTLANKNTGGLPNPYGGSYKSTGGATLPQPSDVTLPGGIGNSSGQSSVAPSKTADLAIPNMPIAGSGSMGSNPSILAYPAGTAGTTPKAELPSYSKSAPSTVQPPATTSEVENRYRSAPASSGTTMPAYPSGNYAPSSAYQGTSTSQPALTPPTAALGTSSAGSTSTVGGTAYPSSTFAPGTTGRTTKYDFSGSTP